MKRKNYDRDAEAKRQVSTVYQLYEGKCGYRQLQLFLWQDDGVWMILFSPQMNLDSTPLIPIE
ncbi:hypothetical protein EIM92_01980 [Paenibacillus lentus]|uniref:Uncharacterized protein n=1 Tax=Paenibacillus lentus TaxID=1338368 RepID=A0A3Q8S8X4_9BACL|nr:hypothetical protein EIM92_01980 [Paenibacillus lentus]